MASSALAQYWSKKWEIGALCDVIINCKDGCARKKIQCHSFILAPAAPIFEPLGDDTVQQSPLKRKSKVQIDPQFKLSTDKETGNTILDSHDRVNYAEWCVFLQWLYYGTILLEKLEPHLQDIASDSLLSAVDKLQVHESIKEAAVAYYTTAVKQIIHSAKSQKTEQESELGAVDPVEMSPMKSADQGTDNGQLESPQQSLSPSPTKAISEKKEVKVVQEEKESIPNGADSLKGKVTSVDVKKSDENNDLTFPEVEEKDEEEIVENEADNNGGDQLNLATGEQNEFSNPNEEEGDEEESPEYENDFDEEDELNLVDFDILNAGCIEGVLSKCVFCWNADKACDDAMFLKCFLCFEMVGRFDLDQHVGENHEMFDQGYFTCMGRTDRSIHAFAKVSEVIGTTVETVLDGGAYPSFMCSFCEFSCTTLKDFRKHLSTKHQALSSKTSSTFRCSNCLIFLDKKSTKDDHEHFCSGNGFPMCYVCFMKFSSPVVLMRHFRDVHPHKRNTKETIVESHPGSFSEKEIEYKLQKPSTIDVKASPNLRSSSRNKKPPHNMLEISSNDAESEMKKKEVGDDIIYELENIDNAHSQKPQVLKKANGAKGELIHSEKFRKQNHNSQVLLDSSSGIEIKVEVTTNDINTVEHVENTVPKDVTESSVDLEGFRSDRSSMCVHCWKNRSLCRLKAEDFLMCFVCFENVRCADLDIHTLQRHPDLLNGYFTCRGGNTGDVVGSTIIGRRVTNDFGVVKHRCALCSFSCSMVQILKNHLRVDHGINNQSDKICFKCDKCYVYFATALARNNHVHFCHGYGPPECTECSERFSSPVLLRKHMNDAHEGVKKPEISFKKRQKHELCRDTGQDDPDYHPGFGIKESDGAGRFDGEIDHLRKGRKRKHDGTDESEGYRSDRNAICLYCWKTKSLCDEAVKLKCFLCSTTVASSELDNHASKFHPEMSFGVFTCQGRRAVVLPQRYGILSQKEPDREKYHCMLCDFIADDPKSIKLHLVEIHKVKHKQAHLSSIARCNTCLSLFSNVVAAEDHQFFCHTKEVKLALPECTQCNMRFSAPNAYKKHMRTTHGEVRKTNLDCYAESMEIDEEKVKNLTPFSFTNTSKEPNLEFDRKDRKSLCVHCWKLNRLCEDVELLKCFVCFDSVQANELDDHAMTHPNCNSGLYTCLGIHNGRLKNTVTYGTVGRKIPAMQPDSADSYECFRCFFNTQNLQHFKDHLSSRHDVKVSKSNFVPRCRYCHLFFTANSVQEDHEYFCRGADLPYCAECNVKFASPNSWRRHCNEVHVGKYGPRKYFSNTKYSGSLLCETCGISFKNKPAMKYHNKTRHGGAKGGQVPYEEREKHVCDFCGATFLRQHTLREHVNFRHTKAKQFKCKFCDRYFLRRSELARHEQMHGKAVAIKCSMCNFQGFTKFELRRHFFKDHKIGQFKCTCCRAKFTDYEKYEEHKFLKLCPRYNVKIDESGKRRRMNRKNAQYQEYAELVAEGADERGDHQLCTWVTETGEVMQAYIRRDMINSEGELQEGLQVLELPNGEMQLVQTQVTEEAQGEENEIPVTQIREGKVQLVQVTEDNVRLQVPIASDSGNSALKTIVVPETKSTDEEPYGLQVVQMSDGRVEVRQGLKTEIVHPTTDDQLDETGTQNAVAKAVGSDISVKYEIGNDAKTGEIQTEDGTVIEYEISENNIESENGETLKYIAKAKDKVDDEMVIKGKIIAEEQSTKIVTGEEVVPSQGQDEVQQVSEESGEVNEEENVMEMSLEAFQAAYGEGALQAVEKEQGKDGYYIVYV